MSYFGLENRLSPTQPYIQERSEKGYTGGK